jgi:hypothetical protein
MLDRLARHLSLGSLLSEVGATPAGGGWSLKAASPSCRGRKGD